MQCYCRFIVVYNCAFFLVVILDWFKNDIGIIYFSVLVLFCVSFQGYKILSFNCVLINVIVMPMFQRKHCIIRSSNNDIKKAFGRQKAWKYDWHFMVMYCHTNFYFISTLCFVFLLLLLSTHKFGCLKKKHNIILIHNNIYISYLK